MPRNRNGRLAPSLKPLLALVGLVFLLTSPGPASAAPGDLDTSFGAGGKSLADFGGNDSGRAVTLQPDGKIVQVGDSTAGGNPDFAIDRLVVPGGTFDSSFGTSGRVRVDFHSGSGTDFATAVALQADGKIVVAGRSSLGFSNQDFAVARLNANGSLDTSFGAGGKMLIDFGAADDAATGVAIRPDGKLVVAGHGTTPGGNDDFEVARLNPNGSLDTSFGAGGKSVGDFGGTDEANALALQPDGKIIIAGDSDAAHAGSMDFAITRLTSTGFFDGSFAGTGRVLVDMGGSEESAAALALQPDGKIVAAGYTNRSGPHDFAVARLNSTGSLDSSFGPNAGWTVVSFNGAEEATGVALQPIDGKIVVAGTDNGADQNFAVARLQGNSPTGFVRAGLVPAFTQCGTGANPSNGSHPHAYSGSGSTASCLPPKAISTHAVVGSTGQGNATITVLPGDFQLQVADADIRTPSGSDYDPTPGAAGTDLSASLRLRITDQANCTPSPCGGPYTQSGTTVDLDFGPVPVDCEANGSATSAPGSDCNITTTADAFMPGAIAAGRQTTIQLFRIRVNDSAGSLFQQQGYFVP